jgi:TldD protein
MPFLAAPLTEASRLLLAPHDLDGAQLADALAGLAVSSIDEADLYFQYARAESWFLEEGIVKSGSFHIEQGVGARAVAGEKAALAYSDEISPGAIKAATEAVRAIGTGNAQGRIALPSSRKTPVPLYQAADPIAGMSADAKVAILHRLEAFARQADSRVIQVMAGLAGQWEAVLIVRSDGRLAADLRPLVRVSLTVIVEENGQREQGHAGGGGRFDYARFDDAVLQDYARQAVHQATLNLRAQPAPAGKLDVVLAPGWPGILLHEAVGHGLEGDFNRKGASVFSGRLGQRVAARGVTVIDDGALPERRGSLSIDDEGTPTAPTVLIEDGILQGYLHDRQSARLMRAAPTGNARRESYAHLPLPRMTNTFMQAGDVPPEEIIASVKNGLYAANFGGGQVDITSGKFVFSMSEAYRIENGKITTPVKGATLIGNGADALSRIRLIGNDLALDPGVGVCGKEGQSVPVGVGLPTVRIDQMTVGGTAL